MNLKVVFLFSLLCAFSAARGDIYDIPRPQLVMDKSYRNLNEIVVAAGYMPMGALSRYWVVGANYTQKFNDNHSWEIINGLLAIEIPRTLKTDLKEYYGLVDADLPILKNLITTNYIFSPFYTKSLLFNSSIIHSQTQFALGGGLGMYSTGSVPTADFGIVQKFFTGNQNSLRFDFRYYYFSTDKEAIKGNITMILAYGWSWGS